MSLLMMQCTNCLKIFSSGFDIGHGTSIRLKGNIINCPFCGSFENIPDGTFKGTVEGIVRVLEQSGNPLEKAREIFDALEKAKGREDITKLKNSSKFRLFKKWLPDSPEKIAAYIAIFYTLYQLWVKNPEIHIDYDVFLNQYNQVVQVEVKK